VRAREADTVSAVARVVVRRRSRIGGRSLTAASQTITNPGNTFRASIAGATTSEAQWQTAAWDYLDRVGELRYYVNWRASAASRCRLVASEFDDDGTPTGKCDNDIVNAIVRDIGGGATGQSQLLGRITSLLTVPGEGYFAILTRDATTEVEGARRIAPVPGEDGMPEDGVEEWFVFSRDEITRKAAAPDAIELTLPDGIKHTYDPQTDVMFRVWQPHPRRATEADSPVRSNRDALNEIVRTTATIDNAGMSRLIGNGIVFVPQEMSLPGSTGAPTAEPPVGGTQPLPPGIPTMVPGSAQSLQDLLYEVGATAYKDQNSMAALLPLIAAAPGEWIKNVTHLRFDSTIPDTALTTRNAAFVRLARGLDVSPERLLGMGESNHWSSWQIDETDVRVHIAPPVELVCAALTQEVLNAALIEEGIDPALYTVWYDATPLTQDPDKTDEANDAHDRGALTTEAYRRRLGFDDAEGYDLTTLSGWEELARDRAAADVSLIPMLAPLLGDPVDEIKGTQKQIVEGESEPPSSEEGEGESEQEPQQRTEPEPEPPPDHAAAVTALCLDRALELSGKRRRTRSNHAVCHDVPPHRLHTRLGPLSADAARTSVRGWDDAIDDELLIGLGLDPAVFRTGITNRAVSLLTEDARVSAQ
jgi:hypothetical protein